MASIISNFIQTSKKSDKLGFDTLRFITSLRYESSGMKAINNCTFLFDPNWVAEESSQSLPVSFFYIKTWKENLETEVSQKTLLFYNSQTTNNASAVKGGLLGVISDNVVNKPKKYILDVILPANPEMISQQYTLDANTISGVTYFEYGGLSLDETGGWSTALSVLRLIPESGTLILNTILKALGVIDNTVADWGSALLNGSDINKLSLEAMRDNRTILKLKMWNGWKFKHVVIESLNITKTGENGDYYEANLTLTEVPIMTFDRKRIQKSPKMSKLMQLGLDSINKIIDSKTKE